LRKPLRVVDILIAGHAAIDGLAQQVSQRKLRVLSSTGVGQVLGDEISEAQPFIQFSHHNKATVRGDA
jgi:hypothetical protein